MKTLTAEVLRLQFTYNAETGELFRRGETEQSGRIATKGYRQICILGKRHMAHRLAWLYVYGEWPSNHLDHINQNKDDNRIENLREVTVKQNAENVTVWLKNRNGRRGVSWVKKSNRWQADIKHNGKTIHLGVYESLLDAVAARIRGEEMYFTHSPYYAQTTHEIVFQSRFESGLGHIPQKTK